MTQRSGDPIGRIVRGRRLLQFQQLHHHERDLFFRGISRSCHRFLDLTRCVLGNGHIVERSSQKNSSTCVSELQRALRVLPVEDVFHGHREGLMTDDESNHGFVDLTNACSQRLIRRRPDHPALHQRDSAPALPSNDAKSRNRRAWVNPQDDLTRVDFVDLSGPLRRVGENGFVDVGVRVHLLHVVQIVERVEQVQ